MDFQCINIRQVPLEVLEIAAFGLGFQHLPRDLANVNAWKTMLDPYIDRIITEYYIVEYIIEQWGHWSICRCWPEPSISAYDLYSCYAQIYHDWFVKYTKYRN